VLLWQIFLPTPQLISVLLCHARGGGRWTGFVKECVSLCVLSSCYVLVLCVVGFSSNLVRISLRVDKQV